MNTWHQPTMLEAATKLFEANHRRKRTCHANHENHLLARTKESWLPEGIQALLTGDYWPRFLKRITFADGAVDALHLTDRIFQHVLLKQLKATFKHIVNPHCLHIHGPQGVKLATKRVRAALDSGDYHYFIRLDIKSYYRAIAHYQLIHDVKHAFSDAKVQTMLTRVIDNAIETPRGYQHDGCGIALRGPLSQLFSALYLKPLDDAISAMDVIYLRYQDDILVLCKTQRQLKRCQQKIKRILDKRHLTLSRKKSCTGHLSEGFHFLGVNYLGAQSQDNTQTAEMMSGKKNKVAQKMTGGGRACFFGSSCFF